MKNDYRMFKVTRIKNLLPLEEEFNRNIPTNTWSSPEDLFKSETITLVLKIDAKMAYRVFDEFYAEDIKIDKDGSFTIRTIIPKGEWIYGYIMSYGENAEVLEPEHIRTEIIRKYEEGVKGYL
jgi:predicted DNA-binding transcriptional regulator YafY